MSNRSVILGLISTFLFASPLFGQHAPICDVTCGPDPSSPTYAGTIQARATPSNSRGLSTVLAPRAAGSRVGSCPSSTNAASQSFDYAIPILNLPGRNGLNVNLTLYYNSRVWTIDSVNGTATFDADRDFPSYGFRLGYGLIEGPFTNEIGTQSYMLTESDGTKRKLPRL